MTTYYYANAGAPGNDGLTELTPKDTLANANAASGSAGDIIRGKGGDLFRTTVDETAKNGRTYNSYGTGKANFRGSQTFNVAGNWTDGGSNNWYLSSRSTDTFFFLHDGILGVRRTSLGALSAQWDYYWDDATDRLYVRSIGNPTGLATLLEVPVPSIAFMRFTGTATVNNVLIDNLKIEHYSFGFGAAAIYIGSTFDAGRGEDWTVSNCEIAYSHNYGVRVGVRTTVSNNYIHHCSQNSIGGGGTQFVHTGNIVENNELSNVQNFGLGNEAGVKFAQQVNFTIRNNNVHDCYGRGIWADTDCKGTISGNLVADCTNEGIFWEACFDATIVRNSVLRCGAVSWYYGAGILVGHSQNVGVYHNTVVTITNGHGINFINQDRDYGTYGLCQLHNCAAKNNIILYVGSGGWSGIGRDNDNALTADLETEVDAFTTEFTGKTLEAGNTAVVSTSPVYTGSKAGKIAFGGTNDGAYVYKSITAQTKAYVRCHMQINAAFAATAQNQVAEVLQIRDNVNSRRLVSVELKQTATSPFKTFSWQVAVDNETVVTDTAVSVTAGVWHYVEVYWSQGGAGTGKAVLFVDGVKVYEKTNGTWNTYTFDRLLVGSDPVRSDPIASGSELYFDEVYSGGMFSVNAVLFDYNCYGNTSGNVWATNNATQTFANWKTFGHDANGINTDPLFVNLAAGDYRLKEASPCRDAGVVIAGINDGTGGSQRFAFAAPDMGAQEYPESAPTGGGVIGAGFSGGFVMRDPAASWGSPQVQTPDTKKWTDIGTKKLDGP
jgi:hypothetical protein